MKLKTASAFEKQLRESAPDHFSKIYVILTSDPFERKFYVKKLFSFLSHYRPKLVLKEGDLDLGLFSDEALIHIETESQIPSDVWVVFSGEKCSQKFYDKIEKEAVCLDLTQEKPWEKKERLVLEVQKMAHPKRITLALAQALVERVGSDLAALKSEVDKLSLYVGERKSIEDADVIAICTQKKEVTGWQIVEALVWRHKKLERQEWCDLSDVLALFSLVRHHLQLGLQICRGETPPSVRKNQLEIYYSFCSKVGPNHFVERLILLFEWEIKAKSSTINPTLLWDLFVIHYDTLLTAQLAPSGR